MKPYVPKELRQIPSYRMHKLYENGLWYYFRYLLLWEALKQIIQTIDYYETYDNR